MRLILASASPRRADLLRAAGFEFETYDADVDERRYSNESAAEYVRRLAGEKSAAVHATLKGSAAGEATAALKGCATGDDLTPVAQVPPALRVGEARQSAELEGGRPADEIIVIGADTTVVVDGTILGKPQNDEEAAAMLRRLSGRRHDVMTGVSVRAASEAVDRVETTAVYFTLLSDDDIAWYVRSGEGRDKAGAYAIQGLASRFIPRIEGSYSNVVGLPVATAAELIAAVRELGRRSPRQD
jgi:septum formation protein